MSWYNFEFAGNVAIQTDDAETANISETGTTAVALAQSIRLTDIVLSSTAAQPHQYSIWVNGKKQSSNLFAAQLNPASQGRFSIRGQGISIPAGATLQMRGAQLSAGALEATTATLEFVAA